MEVYLSAERIVFWDAFFLLFLFVFCIEPPKCFFFYIEFIANSSLHCIILICSLAA